MRFKWDRCVHFRANLLRHCLTNAVKKLWQNLLPVSKKEALCRNDMSICSQMNVLRLEAFLITLPLVSALAKKAWSLWGRRRWKSWRRSFHTTRRCMAASHPASLRKNVWMLWRKSSGLIWPRSLKHRWTSHRPTYAKETSILASLCIRWAGTALRSMRLTRQPSKWRLLWSINQVARNSQVKSTTTLASSTSAVITHRTSTQKSASDGV